MSKTLKSQFEDQVMQSTIANIAEQERQKGIQQLQAQYDAWNAQQAGIAELQAQYDAWKSAQNPQQAQQAQAQTIPSITDMAEKNHQTFIQQRIAAREKALAEKAKREEEEQKQIKSLPDQVEQISDKISNVFSRQAEKGNILGKGTEVELTEEERAERNKNKGDSKLTDLRRAEREALQEEQEAKRQESVKNVIRNLNSADFQSDKKATDAYVMAEAEKRKEESQKNLLNQLDNAEVQDAIKQARSREKVDRVSKEEQAAINQRIADLDNATATNLTDEQKALEEQILNADKYQVNEGKSIRDNILSQEQKDAIIRTTAPETVNKWLSPDYKLTDQDKKAAKVYAQNEISKFEMGPNHQPVLNSPEERQHYANMVNLLNKTSTLASASIGAIQSPYNLAKGVRDAGVSAGSQIAGLGAAITDKLGITEGANKAVNQNVAAIKDFNAQNDASMTLGKQNAETQNPFAYGAGKFGGQIGMYYLTNPLFDGLAAAKGVTGAGRFALNQLGQNAQDIALDSIPRYKELTEDGELSPEDIQTLIKEGAINVGSNAVLGGLGEIPNIAKYVKQKNMPDAEFMRELDKGRKALHKINAKDFNFGAMDEPIEAAQQIAKESEVPYEELNDFAKNIRQGREKLAALNDTPYVPKNMGQPIPNIADDVVDNVVKQTDDVAQSIDNAPQNIAKQASVPENIPVRPGEAAPVSPAIENEAEAMAKAMDANEGKFTLPDDVSDEVFYRIDDLNDTYYKYREAIQNKLDTTDFSIPNATVNSYKNKAGKTVYSVVRADTQKPIKNYEYKTLKSAEKAQADYIKGTPLQDRAKKAFADIRSALYKYEQAAFNADNVEDVNKAKKDLEAARKRYERAMKEYDPNYYDAVSGKDFADKITKPYYVRNPQAENPIDEALRDELAADWVKNDIENPNRFVEDVSKRPDREYSIAEDIGLNPNTMDEASEYSIDPDTGYAAKNTEPVEGSVTAETEMPETKGYKKDGQSRVVTNSAVNAYVVDVDQIEADPVLKDIANYDKHNNIDTFNKAMNNVKDDAEGWKNGFISGERVIGGDTDVDTAMILLQDLKGKMDGAADDATRMAFKAERDALLSKLREYGTRSGQGIQAFAKWNNTYDGAMLNAEKVEWDDVVDPWLSTHQEVKKEVEKVADTLDKIGKVSDVDNAGKATIDGTGDVTNDIGKSTNNIGNKSNAGTVKKRVTNNNSGKKTFNKKARTPEETEAINFKLNKAIEDISAKKKKKFFVEKDHDEILKEIDNTLKKHELDETFDSNSREVLANYIDNIPTWQLTDELKHYIDQGEFYNIDESLPVAREKSSKLVSALRQMGDKTKKPEKVELGYAKRKERIINTLKDEFIEIEGMFDDAAINKLVEFEENHIPTWQLTDELEHYLRHGKFYDLPKEVPEVVPTSNRLRQLLDKAVAGKQIPEKAKKAPDTFEETFEKVKNTLDAENSSVAAGFNDTDYTFIANMMYEKVPSWQIEDELRHRLTHGTWYTLDESTALNIPKSQKLASILDSVVGGKQLEKKPKTPDTFAQTLEKVRNTFTDEYSGFETQFNESDYNFIATMIDEKIPRWQIEDEIRHKLDHGSWYTLDESIAAKTPTNQKLQAALNNLVEGPDTIEKPELTLDEIADSVRNTLEKESMSIYDEFNDDEINYLAGLIKNNASKQDITNALAKKMATGKFGVSAETQQEVYNLFKNAEKFNPNSKQFVEAQAKAFELLAEEIVPKANFFEKFEAWRYLAMLGNPKTMLRNFIGNTLFSTITGISNNIAALGEAGVDRLSKGLRGGKGINRTKTILNPLKDMDLIKAAGVDGDISRYRQMMGSKYEKMDKNALRQAKSVFDSKLVRLYEKATDAGISDYSAIKSKYSTSLAGYLKANGYDKSIFEAETELKKLKDATGMRLLSNNERKQMDELKKQIDALEKGRDYALKEAEYATFHEHNEIAEKLAKFSRDLRNGDGPVSKAGGMMLEGTLPFKRTPANVLKSGMQYSPFGIADSLAKTGKLIFENTGSRKGNLDDVYKVKKLIGDGVKDVQRTYASDVIESWSKTLTGSLMTLLGYYLYNQGVLHVSDEDTKYQDSLEGQQNYAIDINGHTYTLDWAAPAVMPLLLGAQINKVRQAQQKDTEEWYDNLDLYMNALSTISEPIVETSMLSGLRDTLETAANSARYEGIPSVAAGIAGNTLTGYATQAVPTISGQIARTIDNTRRSTYTDKTGIAGIADRQVKKMMNKIPGLSFLNQPYVDTYGRGQKNSPFNNPVGNLAYQMLSPGYYSKVKVTDADKMSREVYDVAKNANVLPEYHSKFKLDGELLSPEDNTQAQQVYGKTNYEIRNALANDEWFKSLEGAQKEEIVKDINTLSEHVALHSIDPEYDKTSENYQAYQNGGIPSLLDYYKGENAKDIAAESGLGSKSKASQEIQEDIKAGNTEAAQQKIDVAKQITDSGISSYGYDVYNANKSRITDVDNWISSYNSIDSYGNSDGFVNQDEYLIYVKKKGLSESEAVRQSKLYGNWEYIPYIKKDGTWGFHKPK